MTDANWIFDRAINLMDEQNEQTGQTQTADTKEYELRTVGILNVLRHEVYPFCECRTQLQPICPEIETLASVLQVDDEIAQGVLPYGLAGHLLLGENDAMANYFLQKYYEVLATIRAGRRGQWEALSCAYGGLDV